MDDVRLKRAVANTAMSESGVTTNPSQLDLINVPFTIFPHYRGLH